MERNDAEARLRFLEAAEALKDTFRSGFTSGGRSEDTAAHTWRLCLWLMVFEDQLGELDIGRLLRMAVIHDLGEAISGDIPATEQTGEKSAEERADFATLLAPLPADLQTEMLALWDEYDGGATPEARIVKGMDKLETILQHTQGANPPGFDHGFNLHYGRQHTDRHPLLVELRRLIDARTRDRMQAAVTET